MYNYQQKTLAELIMSRYTFPRQLLIRFRRHFSLLRWLIPGTLMLLVIAYEAGPARWLHNWFGYPYHLLAEVLLFALVGPVLAFVLLDFLWRWLDERDTSDLQAQLLVQAREQTQRSHRLCDDALQALFAAGTLIATLKAAQLESSPELIVQTEAVEQELSQTIRYLRRHLEG